jgi:arginyl-tRNA--protein-N-Asp/Glu arginylyltransferase
MGLMADRRRHDNALKESLSTDRSNQAGSWCAVEDDDSLVWSPQAEYDRLRNVSPDAPCPYLSGVFWRSEAYWADSLDPEFHDRLMARGFRRSGSIVYRPRCRNCRACLPLRVIVDRFLLSRSQRRVAGKGANVRMEVGKPEPTNEKFDLFQQYLDSQHDATMARTYDSFSEFLYGSPTETLEFSYRLGKQLIGVSIADHCTTGLSSVYMYFDPDHAHLSLGTLSAIREIEYCHLQDLPYYYLGYYIAGSRKMDYKARFRPNEVLAAEGTWVPFRK